MAEPVDDGDYVLTTGRVVSVRDGEVVVRVERNEEDCGGCRSCAVKGLCRGRDTGHMDLRVDSVGAPLPGVGDKVGVAYRSTNAALAALAMFLPALLGLLFGGLVGYRLADGGDAVFLVGCVVGFAAGLAVSWLLTRSVSSLRPHARLVDAAAVR